MKIENLATSNLFTEEVIKRIAEEVVRINDIRKAENKRIDYMAEKVFEQCREKYTASMNVRFDERSLSETWKMEHWKDTKYFHHEASEVWNNIRKSALAAAGVRSEKQAYLESKGDIANAVAEELCEAILKQTKEDKYDVNKNL